MVTWICPNTCMLKLIGREVTIFHIYIYVKSMRSRETVSYWNHFPIFSSGTASWNITRIKYGFEKKHSLSVSQHKHRITESRSQSFNQHAHLKFTHICQPLLCLRIAVTFMPLKWTWTFNSRLIRHHRQARGILLSNPAFSYTGEYKQKSVGNYVQLMTLWPPVHPDAKSSPADVSLPYAHSTRTLHPQKADPCFKGK